MKVATKKIENSQVVLDIEVGTSEVEKSLDETYRRLVNQLSIPGFRRGKAPRPVLERHIGRQTFFQKALEQLIPQVYEQAVKSEGIEAIAQPQIEVIQTEPVILKAIVPVSPTVKLGNYYDIRLESESVEITGEEVDAAIEQLRYQQAVLLPVERSVQFGDAVILDVDASIQGKPVLNYKDAVCEVVEHSSLPLPGFTEKLEGMEKNKQKNFTLSFSGDYAIKEFAGKECAFSVVIAEIKERRLPELNDELARSVGSGDLASLRERISSDLRARAEERARSDFRRRVVDAVVELSEVEYPPVLEEMEIDRLIGKEAGNFPGGMKELEDYLMRMERTVEEHREELRPVAARRLARSLVLDKVAEAGKIEVTASEVDNEVERILKDAGEKAEEARKLLELSQTRKSIQQFILVRKTEERLEQIAEGSAQ